MQKLSIAPSPALIPHDIFIPSSAGPVAHEVASNLFPDFKTISPLVPISIKSKFLSSLYNPLAYTPATISEPTKPDI